MQVSPAIKKIRDFRFEDFELVGYDPHPSIKAAIAV
jgi:thymidylate synthase